MPQGDPIPPTTPTPAAFSYPERGPGEIARFLQDARAELQTLDAQLQEAHDVETDAGERWAEHYDEILEQLEEEHQGGRFPGEDIRISTARRRGGHDAWTTYRRSRRAVRRIENRIATLKAQIGAAQSEGKLGA